MQQPMALAQLGVRGCGQPLILGCEDSSLDFLEMTSDDMPSVLTSRRDRKKDAKVQSRATISEHGCTDLLCLLKRLVVLVNDELSHPDNFSEFIGKLDSVSELNPLREIVNAIDKQGMHTDEVWVAFISWAAQQLGSECQLTRHALRSIQSLSGTIAPGRLAELMVQFNEIEAATNPAQC